MSKYQIGDVDYQIPGSGVEALEWEIGRLNELLAERDQRIRTLEAMLSAAGVLEPKGQKLSREQSYYSPQGQYIGPANDPIHTDPDLLWRTHFAGMPPDKQGFAGLPEDQQPKGQTPNT